MKVVNRGHIGRVLLCIMERRLARYSSLLASNRLPCSPDGESMQPKDPIKRRDIQETLLPTFLCPIDSEDCFELAYEFGVHLHTLD